MGWKGPDKDDKNGNGQDPWGKENGPPDLDEALKQLQRKVAAMFGGGGGGGQFTFQSNKRKGFGAGLIAMLVLIVYILSGIYIVQPGEQAVIKRFGKYIETVGPGPHWIPQLIETRQVVNTKKVRDFEFGAEMLTQDENIIDARVAVQWNITSPKDYLFNLVGPDLTIEQVVESALRSVVGQSSLNEVLTSGRSEVSLKVLDQVEKILASYNAGLNISILAMQQTKAPASVQDAFDDAIKAQQDEERFKNEAQAYFNQRIPVAEGKAKRVLQEAEAYEKQQVLKAEGETSRFTQLLPEYKRQPEIMRDRLYLDTLEEVYTKTPKVIVDVEGGNNLMVLPLDQIVKQTQRSSDNEEMDLAQLEMDTQSPTQASPSRSRGGRPTYQDVNRYRDSRGG